MAKKKVMTPEEFAVAMKEVTYEGIEEGHAAGDTLMENLLEKLGYGEGVKIFQEMTKWYA